MPATAAPPLSDQDVNAIRGIIDPWNRACLNRDWDALLSMCTDDMVFMPPNEPRVAGDALRPWLDAFPVIKEMSWGIDLLEGRGDLARLFGWVKETLEIDGQDVEFNGKYCDTMRKGEDGKWRFSMVIWNSDEAE